MSFKTLADLFLQYISAIYACNAEQYPFAKAELSKLQHQSEEKIISGC
ncbi:hypothetical protein [Dokdonia donghaensis]